MAIIEVFCLDGDKVLTDSALTQFYEIYIFSNWKIRL